MQHCFQYMIFRSLTVFLPGFCWGLTGYAQQHAPIDTSGFRDAAHHWYDIRDKSNMINPLPGRPVYRADNINAIADNIVLFQKSNGGWPKNYDMQAILSAAQQDSVIKARNELHTTFDNGSTYTQIAYLAQAYTLTHKEIYKIAALKGLDYILTAQYKNGGWPQYYPLEQNYSRFITFNDDAYIGIMEVLKDITDDAPQYAFIDPVKRKELVTAFNKGVSCILKTQINDAGQPTGWCQQHNEITLQPEWARKFEPPAICNNESAGIVLLLMKIRRPSFAVKTAIENAVTWFRASAIKDTRIKTIDAPELVTPFTVSRHDRIVVNSPGAPLIWTRYYELKTHRPVFCNRDSKLVYSLAEVDRERRDGYGWYTYEPQRVLDQYDAWKRIVSGN
ncbi:pectate lyase, PelA/Pel-15E family [Sediminibacterium ginsengisoli]|uniref:Pectate lyase, PelA/Pel-15E family n=1 Tax=Sediminibacterium ginsengisoli TaxID=413434 RepID=A0A1T4P9D4_9BACT|nr:pectate lyase, PelA/Pel-15E family [Sediminibacterium ginsengisoli]